MLYRLIYRLQIMQVASCSFVLLSEVFWKRQIQSAPRSTTLVALETNISNNIHFSTLFFHSSTQNIYLFIGMYFIVKHTNDFEIKTKKKSQNFPDNPRKSGYITLT